jgi:hypoxanthine-guanine phosphoribosyltransferase
MGHRPQHGEVLVSAEQVTEGIRALAEFTVERYGGEEEKPLFVGLLRGGMPFASRLMARIVRIDPASTQSWTT